MKTRAKSILRIISNFGKRATQCHKWTHCRCLGTISNQNVLLQEVTLRLDFLLEVGTDWKYPLCLSLLIPEKSGLGKDHSRNGNHIIKTLKNYSKCEEEKCETCMYMACVVQQICLTITPGWMPGLIKISLLPVNAIIKDNGSEIYTTLKKPNIANAAPITIYNEHTWYLSFFYTHTF